MWVSGYTIALYIGRAHETLQSSKVKESTMRTFTKASPSPLSNDQLMALAPIWLQPDSPAKKERTPAMRKPALTEKTARDLEALADFADAQVDAGSDADFSKQEIIDAIHWIRKLVTYKNSKGKSSCQN